MKYIIDESAKTITFEEGTFTIEEFSNRILELSKIFQGYSIVIIPTQAVQPIQWPTNPIVPQNPWPLQPYTPYPVQPWEQPWNQPYYINPNSPGWNDFITYCSNFVKKDDQNTH